MEDPYKKMVKAEANKKSKPYFSTAVQEIALKIGCIEKDDK